MLPTKAKQEKLLVKKARGQGKGVSISLSFMGTGYTLLNKKENVSSKNF